MSDIHMRSFHLYPYCYLQYYYVKRPIQLIVNCRSDYITTQIPRFPRLLTVASASTNTLVHSGQSTCIHAFVFPFIRILTSKHTYTNKQPQTTTTTSPTPSSSSSITQLHTQLSFIHRSRNQWNKQPDTDSHYSEM